MSMAGLLKDEGSYVYTLTSLCECSDPSTWNNGEVIRWLRENDLKELKDAVYSNGFDGAKIIKLSGAAFKVRCRNHFVRIPTHLLMLLAYRRVAFPKPLVTDLTSHWRNSNEHVPGPSVAALPWCQRPRLS